MVNLYQYKTHMYRFQFLLIFFITNFVTSQSTIQHGPERLFNQIIGMPTTEYAKKNNLKKIIFLRDTTLSSSIEFDESGNFIETVGMENNYVRRSTYKWDDQNRMIETKKFNPDNSFRYGYYYKYKDGAQLMFKLEDSLLFRKEIFLKKENIRVYSEYNPDGSIRVKNVYVKDDDNNYLLESRFQRNRLYVQYRYEYIDNKKYVTKIQYDDNGTKTSEKRHLDEIEMEDKIEHYTDDERIFRIDNFDKNGNLLTMKLVDENMKPTRVETSIYDDEGKIVSKEEKYYLKNNTRKYIFKYDDLGRPDYILKSTNGSDEIFRYKYYSF